MTTIEELIEQLVRRVVREELAARASESAPPQYLTVAAFAAARSIGESTVRKAVRDGRLPAIRIGRAVRVQSKAEIGRRARSAPDLAWERAAKRLGIR